MVKTIEVTSVLNKLKKRDEWFLCDYSINPYYGCGFNCLYCYIRGSKYGTNMTTTLALKSNARKLLERQLARRARKGEYGIIALGSSTEAYVPIKKGLELTRDLLTIMLRYRFPVEIGTKSTLVLKDLDILKEIDENAILPEDLQERLQRGVIISFSISTLDEELASIVEPGAPRPHERLETMKECKEKGFLTGVNFIPVLPYLSDSEGDLDMMIITAKEYGADFVFIGGLTLFGDGPDDCKTLYYNFLKKHYPDLVPKYKRLYRVFHYPNKEYSDKLTATAKRLCMKHGMRNSIV